MEGGCSISAVAVGRLANVLPNRQDEPMFQIKVCGITCVEDARATAEAGADAIGINFYARSPRVVSPEQAREIVTAVPREVMKVGLFVNEAAARVCQLFDELHLDLIQLHGDETPEFFGRLRGRPIIKVFRVGAGGLVEVRDYLAQCEALGVRPRAVLLDALSTGGYGGTGKQADWDVAKAYQEAPGLPPLVLAGGLTPDNVATAIRSVGPKAVDVASGVESSPGRKDAAAVAAFVEAARGAFNAMGPDSGGC